MRTHTHTTAEVFFGQDSHVATSGHVREPSCSHAVILKNKMYSLCDAGRRPREWKNFSADIVEALDARLGLGRAGGKFDGKRETDSPRASKKSNAGNAILGVSRDTLRVSARLMQGRSRHTEIRGDDRFRWSRGRARRDPGRRDVSTPSGKPRRFSIRT